MLKNDEYQISEGLLILCSTVNKPNTNWQTISVAPYSVFDGPYARTSKTSTGVQ